jgi:hypothetical protein
VCLTGLTGVEPLSESCSVLPVGTGLTGGAHRSDRCGSVDSRFGVPLRSRVRRLCVGSMVQWHSSGYVGLANLGSESETCVGSRVHLVGVSISFEKNFYRLPFTPPSLVRRIGPSLFASFWLSIACWSLFLFVFFSFSFLSCYFRVGVVNALIKGEIEDHV